MDVFGRLGYKPRLMAKSIHILTYGCQMNDYESDRTFRLFHDEHGYAWSEDPLKADVVIFNTCSIREKADQKARSTLGDILFQNKTKKKNPDQIVAMGGCMAQVQGDEIQKRFPEVDIVFGTHQWAKLPELIERARNHTPSTETDLFGWQTYSFLPFKKSKEKYAVSEVVTVQNGCDKFCTFCVVPFTRGRQVSRSLEDIVTEVQTLVETGTKEVTLLGQNVNAYGNDRSSSLGFSTLLQKVSEVEGLERIRFFTSHPSELTLEMIDAMADLPKVCRSLHLPIQSGSNRILKKMNRDYTVEHVGVLAEYLRKKIPDVTLTTDLIVGFPSETEQEFQETLEVMKKFGFEESYSFCFSPRPNTKAEHMQAEFIEMEVARERLYRLQALQLELSKAARAKYVGKAVQVLVEGTSAREATGLTGKTSQNWSVNFEGPQALIGKLIDVRITENLNTTFRGKIENALIQNAFDLPLSAAC